MANLNKVFLIGNLTRDPELRYIPSGSAVANFTVAANRSYTLQSGEKRDETTFVKIVVWGRRAEVCGEYLSKGSSVFVEGRLQSRTWEAQDGTKRVTTEVVANNVQFLGTPRRTPAKETPPHGPESQEPLDIEPEVDVPPEPLKENTGQSDRDSEVPF